MPRHDGGPFNRGTKLGMPSFFRAVFTGILAVSPAWPAACLAEPTAYAPGLYHLEWQTVLPHLEEMRRTREKTTRCLTGTATELFPVMMQPALRGCSIEPSPDTGPEAFAVDCQTDLVATGHARITRDRADTKGDLNIKMGGKNMTFSQHVRATRLGGCSE